MAYDTDRLDEVFLALLHLNSFTEHDITRAWKSLDWDSLNRLHARGLISDPKSKAIRGPERRRCQTGSGVVREAIRWSRITRTST